MAYYLEPVEVQLWPNRAGIEWDDDGKPAFRNGDVHDTIDALTDSTGGTADGTVAAISGSGADADINNNFKEIVVTLNKVTALLRDMNVADATP